MTPRPAWIAAALLLLGAGTAAGHHSFAMEYDEKKPVRLTGIVTRVEWANPHVRFYIDVAGAGGAATAWELTLPSTNHLLRRGWTRRLLAIGDMVTVDGFQARNGSALANVWLVTLSSGRRVPAGLPIDEAPPAR